MDSRGGWKAPPRGDMAARAGPLREGRRSSPHTIPVTRGSLQFQLRIKVFLLRGPNNSWEARESYFKESLLNFPCENSELLQNDDLSIQ